MSEPATQRGSACTKLGTTWKSSLQPKQKRCWSTALQKLLLQSFTVETQRVGRARSPLRAGVGHAGVASRFESCFPRLHGRGYEPSENIRRAEDRPPYQAPHFGKAKSFRERLWAAVTGLRDKRHENAVVTECAHPGRSFTCARCWWLGGSGSTPTDFGRRGTRPSKRIESDA